MLGEYRHASLSSRFGGVDNENRDGSQSPNEYVLRLRSLQKKGQKRDSHKSRAFGPRGCGCLAACRSSLLSLTPFQDPASAETDSRSLRERRTYTERRNLYNELAESISVDKLLCISGPFGQWGWSRKLYGSVSLNRLTRLVADRSNQVPGVRYARGICGRVTQSSCNKIDSLPKAICTDDALMTSTLAVLRAMSFGGAELKLRDGRSHRRLSISGWRPSPIYGGGRIAR